MISKPEEAAEELLHRKNARKSLAGFAEYFKEELMLTRKMEPHHYLVCDKLTQLAYGNIKRLMLFLPPGSAKSTYGSIAFPAFFYGIYPQLKVLGVSHSTDFAVRFSRKARNVMMSPRYQVVFPQAMVDPKTTAVENWQTGAGGEYMAAGAGKGISGYRSHLAIMDDPIGSREDADSPRLREKVWEWFRDDVENRLQDSESRILLIMTRWHEDDLAGRLLERQKSLGAGNQWEVVRIPLEAEDIDDPLQREIGEVLWPDVFTPDVIAVRKSDMRSWASLQQQRPAPQEGGIFKRDWIQHNDEYKGYSMIVQSWDTAYKASQMHDHSVCTTWGINTQGYELLHVLRRRMEYPELRKTMVQHADDFNATCVLIEDKGSGQSLLQDGRNLTRIPLVAINPESDKITRASVISTQFEGGKVWLPRQAHWLEEYLSELLQFPNSKHDDQVDSTSQFLGWIVNKGYDMLKDMRDEQLYGDDDYEDEDEESDRDDLTGY